MMKKNYEGNDKYEGYLIDLLEELSRIVKFNFTLSTEENTMYNTLVDRLEDKEIDMVVADLTYNKERAERIDFSSPFMNLGIGIIYKQENELRFSRSTVERV